MAVRFALLLPLAALPLLVFAPGAVRADNDGLFAVDEENDSIIFHSDKHYTQGIRFSYLSGAFGPTDPVTDVFAWFGDEIFPQSGSLSRHTDWALGQSMFTPFDIFDRNPVPGDRPYAGWTYLSGGLIQDTDRRRLDDLELQIGVVGPASLANQTQTDWHNYLLGDPPADGWSHQLSNEPGLDLVYGRKWRVLDDESRRGWGEDLIVDAGGSLGNVLTYANGGVLLRMGYGLTSDYGPTRIQPAQSGSDYFNPDEGRYGRWGGYFYLGAEGRAVGRNIFLDGNTFQASPHVDKLPLVGDFTYGAALYYGRYLRLTMSVTDRSDEFVGQSGPDRFESMMVQTDFDW